MMPSLYELNKCSLLMLARRYLKGKELVISLFIGDIEILEMSFIVISFLPDVYFGILNLIVSGISWAFYMYSYFKLKRKNIL